MSTEFYKYYSVKRDNNKLTIALYDDKYQNGGEFNWQLIDHKWQFQSYTIPTEIVNLKMFLRFFNRMIARVDVSTATPEMAIGYFRDKYITRIIFDARINRWVDYDGYCKTLSLRAYEVRVTKTGQLIKHVFAESERLAWRELTTQGLYSKNALQYGVTLMCVGEARVLPAPLSELLAVEKQD